MSKPEAQQKQWGGNLGGPLIRNKLHFFANLERIDQNRARTININARPELNFTDFTHDNVWNWMVRVDHQINASNTWAVRWLRETSPQTNQYTLDELSRRADAEEEQDTDWTMVGTLNSVRRQHSRQHAQTLVTHEDVFFGNPGYFETGDQAAWRRSSLFQTFTDGISTRANRRMDPGYQIDETFAWFVPGKKGRSRSEVRRELATILPLHVFDASTSNGVLHLLGERPGLQSPADPRTYPDRLQVRVPGDSDYFVKGQEVGVFAQDKWKINRRLTASVGLRYDLEVVPIEPDGQLPVLRPDATTRSTRTTSRRGSGRRWVLDDDETPPWCAAGGDCTSRRRRTRTSRRLSARGRHLRFVSREPVRSSDRADLPVGDQRRPRSVGRPAPDESVPRERPDREQGAAERRCSPRGRRKPNTGTVNFDDPDRHLPWSRQASIGIEKSFAANLAVSADYIHSEYRDLYMREDLNPGSERQHEPAPATLRRIDPRFTAAVLKLSNHGYANYNALQASVNKRFSNRYQFRVSYTLSKADGIVAAAGATDTINTITVDPATREVALNLDDLFQLSDQDRPHNLSLSGSVEVPKTKGLVVSGAWQYQSGTPFTLTDSSTDPNRNGIFEEPLPAGTYSGPAYQPELDHGGLQRRHQRGARTILQPREHARGLSVQAARESFVAGARRRLQRHEPRELQQPDGGEWWRDELRPARRRVVSGSAVDSRRWADADRPVQPEIRLLDDSNGPGAPAPGLAS